MALGSQQAAHETHRLVAGSNAGGIAETVSTLENAFLARLGKRSVENTMLGGLYMSLLDRRRDQYCFSVSLASFHLRRAGRQGFFPRDLGSLFCLFRLSSCQYMLNWTKFRCFLLEFCLPS